MIDIYLFAINDHSKISQLEADDLISTSIEIYTGDTLDFITNDLPQLM